MDFYERRAEELRQQLEEAEEQERESRQKKEVRPEDEAFEEELRQLITTTRKEARDALQFYLAGLDDFLQTERLSPQTLYQEVNIALVNKRRQLLVELTGQLIDLGVEEPEDLDRLDEGVRSKIRVIEDERDRLRDLIRFLHLFRTDRKLDENVPIGQIRDLLQARIAELTKILESRREDT